MSEHKPTVMLVDDEPRILSALRRVLRREGFEILSMGDARSALAELEIRDVDLVVSDQRMPGISGVALLEQVARKWPDTARILLSGWSNEVPPESLAAAKVVAVMSKPWDEEALKSVIRDALDARVS